MRLAFVVSKFPKVTETFIQREILHFSEASNEIRLFHLTAFRNQEIVHAFARPVVGWTRYYPYWFSKAVISSLFAALINRPMELGAIIGTICRECWRRPLLLIKSLSILPKSLAIAQELKGWGADHIHAEFAGHPATCAWIVGRMTGLPYSVSCHAHDIFISQALLLPKLKEAAFVRSISEFNKSYLCQRLKGIDASSIYVIHCGLQIKEITPSVPPDDSEFRVLYVGSLTAKKGVDVLIRALANLKNIEAWSCDIIGDGPNRQDMEALVVESGIEQRVKFRGSQPFEAIAAAHGRAHVLVVPSVIAQNGDMEGIPTVAMEGLALQTPVIASRLSGVPELIRASDTGQLVDPGDVCGLARAIEWVYQNPAAAAQQASRGRKLMETQFNLSLEADKQLALFKEFSKHIQSTGSEATQVSV